MANLTTGGEVDDKDPSSRDRRVDGSVPTWVRWGCTALLLVGCGGLALYMFAS
jgi:hypothetical protein